MNEGRELERRRANWNDIVIEIALLRAHLHSEFGNGDTEGNLTRRLNRIEKLIESQNGRVSRLEIWRSFIVGGIAVWSFVITIILIIFKR